MSGILGLTVFAKSSNQLLELFMSDVTCSECFFLLSLFVTKLLVVVVACTAVSDLLGGHLVAFNTRVERSASA